MPTRGEVFLVNLAGLELPDKVLTEIEHEINRVVEAKVAAVDKVKGKITKIPLGGPTRGIWMMKEFIAK